MVVCVRVDEEFGGLDIFVNNVGFGDIKLIEEMMLVEWDCIVLID